MINVLVVDDSAFMRKMLTEFINSQADMTTKAVARNGSDALEKLSKESYDVMTLDVEMPVMTGIDVLKKLPVQRPAVIMVSSKTQRGSDMAVQALELGAVEIVAKPSGSISLDIDKVKEEFLSKIRAAAAAGTGKLLQSRTSFKTVVLPPAVPTEQMIATSSRNVLAIGTSTGGPKALQTVIPALPASLAAPVFIVQHMPPSFTESLAKRLNQLSALEVKEASHNETAENGVVYIAPGGRQMRVGRKEGRVFLSVTDEEANEGHRPSVDVLFKSLAALNHISVSAAILTGMGKDGTEGVKRLLENHNVRIAAESAETAVIYGMPKAAAQLDGVESLPLEQVAAFLTRSVSH